MRNFDIKDTNNEKYNLIYLTDEIFSSYSGGFMKILIIGASATGDVAEFNGKSISLWMPATLNAFDCKIFSIGNISGDETLSYNELNKSVYRKLIFKDNQLAGEIFINSMELSMKLKNGINNKLTKESAIELLK